MGKLFDKLRKYAADEEFEDEYYEDEYEDDDSNVDFEELEDEPASDDYEENVEMNGKPDDEDPSLEVQDADESVDEFEEIEEIEEESEAEVDFEDEETAEDEKYAEDEEFAENAEYAENEEAVEDKESSAEEKRPDKPSHAEMIAAFFQEDEPLKKKREHFGRDRKAENKRGKSADSYQDEDMNDAAIRRQERHKRRVRNQILAYVITFAVIAGLSAGGYFGVRAIINAVKPAVMAETEETTATDAALEALNESEEEIVIEAPESMNEEEEPTQEDYLEEVVDACISAMPIEDKVAQLFIVTPESLTGSNKVTQAGQKTQEMLEKYRVGGFIYTTDNLVDKEQTINMLSATTGYNLYDMFLCVDEEGGKVARVQASKIDVPEVGPMAEIGASGDTNKAYDAGKTIGEYLRELGFNVDFAPVADVVTSTDKTAIGDRSFGSDPATVGQMAAKCAEGIQETGVSACLKHFPGLGDSTADTHKERVVIDKSLEEMQATDFVAFKEAIDNGVDFVMVSHATATGIDEVYPASLSKKVITEQLRDNLGYDGIVITDALNMKAITEYFTTEEACVKAIKAGADIILMPDNFETAYNAVLDAVKDGTISEDRIDKSLKRIFRVKKKDDIG